MSKLSVFIALLCFSAIKGAPSISIKEALINTLQKDLGVPVAVDAEITFAHERGDHFESDIVLTPATFAGGKSPRWTNRQIPYYIDDAINANERNVISQAISEIHGKTCIRLIPASSNQQNHVRFMKTGRGCFSNVGMVGNDRQRQQVISLDSGCYFKGTVVHEIIHAIGFWHEQSRKDRDDYVTINYSNIPNDARSNFNKFDDTNSFNTPYDYSSIMHYSAYAFAINRMIPTINSKTHFPNSNFGKGDGRGGMTSVDATQINKMYGC